MKPTTKLIAPLFFCFVILGSTLSAQEKKPQLSARAKQRIENQLASMDRALQLTDQQKAKIRALLEADAAKIDFSRMREMSREERFEMMQKMREQREKTNKEIEKLLAPEQVKKFQKYLEEMRSRRRRFRRR